DTDVSALQPGVRLKVPFGRQELTGVLLDTADTSEVPRAKLKAARRLLDDSPSIPPDMLALARWAADYYRHPIGEVVQTLLPVALRQGKAAEIAVTPLWRLNAVGREADPEELKRAPRRRPLQALLSRHPAGLEPAALAEELPEPAAALRALIKRGWVEDAVQVDGPTHVEIPLPVMAGKTELN